MADFVSKLITLTNEFIEAVGTTSTAKQVRDGMVAEIFPALSDADRAKFSLSTERSELLRFVSENFWDILDSDEAIEAVIKSVAKEFRLSEDVQNYNKKQEKFAAGLDLVDKLVLLTNGDILGTASYSEAHERRLSLVFEVFGGLSDPEIDDMYSVTEMDDAMREFKDVPLNGDVHYRSMEVALRLENLKAQCYPKSHNGSSGDDSADWEPF